MRIMGRITELGRPNPLQVLLLVLIKYGLSTPYEVQSMAGMSVGLTLGPLRRLQETGLLTCETGTRNKLQYALTPKGDDELRAALEDGNKKDWWFKKFGIFESIPRAIILAWLSSDLKDAPRWLGNAAEDLLREANTKEKEAEGLQRQIERFKLHFPGEDIKEQGIFIATTYQWMKTVADAALLRAQAELVDTLMPRVLSLLPPPPLLEREAATKSKQQRKAANSK
jgi:DNA-binding PadR family transcriptional regulator